MNVRGKALLTEGARRMGKSTICEEFGKNEYESYIIHPKNLIVKDGTIRYWTGIRTWIRQPPD